MILRIAFLSFCLLACQQKPEAPAIRPVRAIQAQMSTQAQQRPIFPGLIRAFYRADLSFRIEGMVLEKPIAVGQQVQQGEILLNLDPREYEVALKKAQGTLENVQAQLNFAEGDYKRMMNIYKADPGAISMSLLDRRKESVNQFKGELQTAQAGVEKAADDLKYTVLKAPFDGMIAAIYVEAHEQVKAKEPVVRLLDSRRAEMDINIPEKYISQLLEKSKTAQFKVKLDAFPTIELTAVITEIGTESSSTTRTYPVTLSIQNIPKDLHLLAGMSGSADLTSYIQEPESNRSFIYLPKEALFSDGHGNDYVWKVDPSTHEVHKQKITIKERTPQGAMISENVQAGDWIVTAGVSFLTEGQHIRIIE